MLNLLQILNAGAECWCVCQLGGVSAIEASGNFMFDPISHRDVLGACMGTGIVRGKVGDILMDGEQGAQLLVIPELVPHFEMALTQVLE